MKPLSLEQQQWVEKTLSSLSLEERVAQLLIPRAEGHLPDGKYSFDAVIEQFKRIPCGGLFVWWTPVDVHRERLARLQEVSRVPVVISADLESGAGYIADGMTQFPDNLAVAAAGREDLAHTMGQAAAVEGRYCGMHWTFAPVVDVNVNPDNPIANTRSLGDNPSDISRLASAIVRGLQEHGLAGCAKHFPGDGIDDTDQHIVTSVNSLSLEDWKRISGRTFAAAFEADVMSVMIGHIALPAWDGETDRRGALRPATLSRRIVTDLLRREMGFEGLIVTDDMNMGGVSGYAKRTDRTVGCIAAGCDMLLFPLLPDDYDILLDAVKTGRLSEARVNDAARRVLEFKARLNLHMDPFGPKPTKEQQAEFASASRTIAEAAVHCVRDVNGLLPMKDLKPGSRILTVTVTNDGIEAPVVDEELRRRGFEVEHVVAQGYGAVDPYVKRVDAIFVNMTLKANWAMGSPRAVGGFNRMFMNGFYMEHPRVVFTSFGSPYHLRQFSTFPNYINVHSLSAESQRAAVAAWLGEIPMNGKSPVGNLTRTF